MRISGDCFANFVADFHTTFVPVLYESHKYFMCRELVTKFLNLFKNFMRVFSPKYFARVLTRLSRYSWDVRESVANSSPQNFGKFTMQNFCDARMNDVRVWYEVRATVLRKKCEHLTTIWRENKTKQHSFQCHATVIRMKMKISYIRGKVGRHSHECLVTVVHARYIFKIRLKLPNLFHKRPFSETAT